MSNLEHRCTGCAPANGDPLSAEASTAIGRRTFVVQSALMSAAAALAACAGGFDNTAPTLASGTTIIVINYPALNAVGGIALVTAGGAQLAVVRTGTASFVVLSRVCPHQGGTIGINGAGFRCPNHGAEFNSTGTWTGGQPTSNMHSYATSYDAATGVLTIS